MSEKDYIGSDPVKWVERLLDVNEGSFFEPDEKEIIRSNLNSLRGQLIEIQEDA